MNNIVIYICEVRDKGMVHLARIELNHLVPPIATTDCAHSPALLDMALHAVQLTDGPKLRCDLKEMRLVDPSQTPMENLIRSMEDGQ